MNLKHQLKLILLIDDDEATNFLHELTLKRIGIAEKIITKQSAVEALKYLSQTKSPEYINPDIIFLDINMPAMNGWEFLEEYTKITKKAQANSIIMLTTSLDPDDKLKAQNEFNVNDFINKPLSMKAIDELVNKHFKHLLH